MSQTVWWFDHVPRGRTTTRVALAVHQVGEDRDETVESMLGIVQDASRAGAALVVVSEAAPTGLTLDDVPATDMARGDRIGGRLIDRLPFGVSGSSSWTSEVVFDTSGAHPGPGQAPAQARGCT